MSARLVLAGLLLGLMLAIGWVPHWTDGLILDRQAVFSGQWWRVFTANFTHLGSVHAGLNTVVLIVLLAWAHSAKLPMQAVLFLLVAGPVLCGELLLLGVGWYAGLSGLLHGLFIFLVLNLPAGIRFLGLGLLAVKLYWQYHTGSDLAFSPQVPVLHQAHWLGATIGLLYFLVWRGQAKSM